VHSSKGGKFEDKFGICPKCSDYFKIISLIKKNKKQTLLADI